MQTKGGDVCLYGCLIRRALYYVLRVLQPIDISHHSSVRGLCHATGRAVHDTLGHDAWVGGCGHLSLACKMALAWLISHVQICQQCFQSYLLAYTPDAFRVC
jgi:hypothetical protein